MNDPLCTHMTAACTPSHRDAHLDVRLSAQDGKELLHVHERRAQLSIEPAQELQGCPELQQEPLDHHEVTCCDCSSTARVVGVWERCGRAHTKQHAIQDLRHAACVRLCFAGPLQVFPLMGSMGKDGHCCDESVCPSSLNDTLGSHVWRRYAHGLNTPGRCKHTRHNPLSETLLGHPFAPHSEACLCLTRCMVQDAAAHTISLHSWASSLSRCRHY